MAQGLSPASAALVDDLTRLPGVGQKTAQRRALSVLERDRQGALAIAGRNEPLTG